MEMKGEVEGDGKPWELEEGEAIYIECRLHSRICTLDLM